jgi:hypothetical protein
VLLRARKDVVAVEGEGMRQMTMKKVPSVQAASMIFKGH